MKIKFIRFNDKVRLPERKHYSDTGADIYMYGGGVIPPMSNVEIPLGFGIDIPNGYTARIQVRTSMARKGLFIQQCAIDAGYKGELHMLAVNLSNNPIVFNANDRLGYIEVYPCVYPEFVEELGEERGDGWAGSTNESNK